MTPYLKPLGHRQVLNWSALGVLTLAEEMHHLVSDHQHWQKLSESGLEASRRRTPQALSAQWIELLQCAVKEKIEIVKMRQRLSML